MREQLEAILHRKAEAIQGFLQRNEYTSADMQGEGVSPVECMLHGNYLGQHSIFFDLADQFLKLGAQLPNPIKTRNQFPTTTEYLSYLISNTHDLYIALRANPDIVKEQDEEDKTMLHYAAEIGLIRGSNGASLILDLLFNAPNVDFNIPDKEGNTPVHCAAMHTYDRVTNQYIFPQFVSAACEKGFNFDFLNKQGLAIIHIVIIVEAYTDYVWGRRNTVGKLLEIVGDRLNKDVLSASGSTAFYYAINRCYISEANALLAAGASPTLFGSPDRDPVAMITKYINEHDALKSKLLGLKKADEEKTSDIYVFENRKFFLELGGQENIETELRKLAEQDAEELVTISDEDLEAATQNVRVEEWARQTLIALREARSINAAEQYILKNRNLFVDMAYKSRLQRAVQTRILSDIDTALDHLDAGPMDLRMELEALREAEQDNNLTQYVTDHAEFLVGYLQLLDFQEKLPDLLLGIDKRIENLGEILCKLKSLKERMLSIQFTEPQERGERFSFWGRAEESKKWREASCPPAYYEFSGPNC